MFFLVVQLIRIINNPIPNPHYSMLSYKSQKWFLHDIDDQPIPFERARVVINTGLFFLLELSISSKRKFIVIFSDQIANDDCRLLNIIEKIR